MTVVKRTICLVSLFVLLANVTSFPQSVNVPLDHWAYEFLDRMQTRGFIHSVMTFSRPYSRNDIAEMLAEVDTRNAANEITLSSAETAIFEQLKGEFFKELKNHDISSQDRYHERHFARWQKENNQINIDLLFQQNIDIKTGDQYENSEKISHPTWGGTIRGKLKDDLGFYLLAKNTLIKGKEISQGRFDPSSGEPITISGENAYTDDASAYFVWRLPWFHMELGRDQIQWGPGVRGQLMISANNPFFDLLKINVQFKRFTFTSIHGKLNSGIGSKFITAHRLELKISHRFILGASESVIYGNRNAEPMYLNPLMIYQIAEKHLGDRDNNTMSFDCVAFPIINHRWYFELFIDDFTTAENPWTYYGNKFAFLTGWQWTNPFGLPNIDLQLEYARIEPFVYTHKDSINTYKNYDQSMGHWLGPNADNLFFKANFWANRDLKLSLITETIRHGEGSIGTPHQMSMGIRKKFLSGTVESIWTLGIEMRCQIFRDGFLSCSFYHLNTKNVNRMPNQHATDNHINLKLSINY